MKWFFKNRDDLIPKYFGHACYDSVVGFVLAHLLFKLWATENDLSFFTWIFFPVSTPRSEWFGSSPCGNRYSVGRQKVGTPEKNFVYCYVAPKFWWHWWKGLFPLLFDKFADVSRQLALYCLVHLMFAYRMECYLVKFVYPEIVVKGRMSKKWVLFGVSSKTVLMSKNLTPHSD